MRTLPRMFCALLALMLAALALLPAAVFADEAGIPIDEKNFPDAKFRAWLEDPAHLNGAGEDKILTTEELTKVTELNLAGLQLTDLAGVAHFTALESLNVRNNQLTDLDLKANTKLKYLNCATNFLLKLDVSGCGELLDLNCERNRLETLDLSGNPRLVQLYCRHNALSALDVSRNTELVFIETFDNRLTSFDSSKLTKLQFLHIDYNQLTTLDMSANTALKGTGFVAANNHLQTLVLPNIKNLKVDAEDFWEQNPRTGYDRVEWYRDAKFTQPIQPTDSLNADGSTLYARWVPNPYTIYYRANKGQGNMEPQKVVYDQTFALTANGFTRTGYTFTGWNTYADGAGGKAYSEGQKVSNLSGANGSRGAVYLYAQWKPNTYTIRYLSDAGSGSTSDTSAKYDADVKLAENGFVNDQGVFLGWARDGKAKQPEFVAGQAVRNLTAEAGGTVTLYAVWMANSEIQQGYQDQLDALQARFSEANYYARDWTALTGAVDAARQAVRDAGSDKAGMQKALSDAVQKAEEVPTRVERADEAVKAWEGEHSAILKRLESFVPQDARAEYAGQAAAAVKAAEAAALAEKTGLAAPEDKAAAGAAARTQLEGRLKSLESLQKAAAWLDEAAAWTGKPLSEVQGRNVQALEDLEEKQALELDESARAFCDPAAVQALSDRSRLARAKSNAVKALVEEFLTLTGKQPYTEENRQKLEKLRGDALAEIEKSEDAGHAAALSTAATAAMQQVAPNPLDPGVSAWPAAADLVRGQKLSQSALTGGKAQASGRFVWKDGETQPQADGSYAVVFVPDDARYASVEGKTAVKVSAPAAPPANKPANPPASKPANPPVNKAPAAQAPAVNKAPAKAAVTPAPAAQAPAKAPAKAPAATQAPKATPAPTAAATPAPKAEATPAPTEAPAREEAEAPAESPAPARDPVPVWLLACGGAALLALAVVLGLRAWFKE